MMGTLTLNCTINYENNSYARREILKNKTIQKKCNTKSILYDALEFHSGVVTISLAHTCKLQPQFRPLFKAPIYPRPSKTIISSPEHRI